MQTPTTTIELIEACNEAVALANWREASDLLESLFDVVNGWVIDDETRRILNEMIGHFCKLVDPR